MSNLFTFHNDITILTHSAFNKILQKEFNLQLANMDLIILFNLEKTNNTSMSKIMQMPLYSRHRNMTYNARKLRKLNLILLSQDPNCKRNSIVSLSDLGKDVVECLNAFMREIPFPQPSNLHTYSHDDSLQDFTATLEKRVRKFKFIKE